MFNSYRNITVYIPIPYHLLFFKSKQFIVLLRTGDHRLRVTFAKKTRASFPFGNLLICSRDPEMITTEYSNAWTPEIITLFPKRSRPSPLTQPVQLRRLNVLAISKCLIVRKPKNNSKNHDYF